MFAYCLNNPVILKDPSGATVYGVGGSISAGFAVGGSFGIMTIWDDKGNTARVITGYYGGGTPNIGVSLDFVYSNTDDIFQYIYGNSVVVGGSITAFSVNVSMGNAMNGNSFEAYSASLGIGLPVELHGGMEYTQIIELLEYNDLEIPNTIPNGFFSSMDPWVFAQLPAQYRSNGAAIIASGPAGRPRTACTK